ncbi:protealysin inhibitor emfourin [Actinomycetospora aeridis]|uniref:Protealysin inhibitor emfourin n=1 Tax=Actinomycetospora aeridis TaxID=3129231 RepID=A0ABU8NAC7_9PSEU
MKITVTERGGFAAAVLRAQPDTVVDTADLASADAAALEGVARTAVARTAGDSGEHRARPDEQSYRVVVDDHGEQSVIKAYDSTMDPAVADLLERVRRHAPSSGGDR